METFFIYCPDTTTWGTRVQLRLSTLRFGHCRLKGFPSEGCRQPQRAWSRLSSGAGARLHANTAWLQAFLVFLLCGVFMRPYLSNVCVKINQTSTATTI